MMIFETPKEARIRRVFFLALGMSISQGAFFATRPTTIGAILFGTSALAAVITGYLHLRKRTER